MEVDASIGGSEAEDIFVIELLWTGPESIQHGAVEDCGKNGLNFHAGPPLTWYSPHQSSISTVGQKDETSAAIAFGGYRRQMPVEASVSSE